jgi:hypothetical protein
MVRALLFARRPSSSMKKCRVARGCPAACPGRESDQWQPSPGRGHADDRAFFHPVVMDLIGDASGSHRTPLMTA